MDFHRSLCYWKAAKLARDLSHRQVQSFVYLGYDTISILVSWIWVGIIHSGIIFSFLSSTFFFGAAIYCIGSILLLFFFGTVSEFGSG